MSSFFNLYSYIKCDLTPYKKLFMPAQLEQGKGNLENQDCTEVRNEIRKEMEEGVSQWDKWKNTKWS